MKSKQNIGRILLITSIPLTLIATILFFVAGTVFGYVGGAFLTLTLVGSIISLIFTLIDTKVPLVANLITNGLAAGFAGLGSILGVVACTSSVAGTIACAVIGFLLGLTACAIYIVCCLYKVRFVRQVVYKELNTTKESNN